MFPSTLAYLCFNRGVQLIGANRAAPFFHVVPVFGSVMAIVFLGERPQLFHVIGFALVLTGVFVACAQGIGDRRRLETREKDYAGCVIRNSADGDAVDNPGEPRRPRTIRRYHAARALKCPRQEFTSQQAIALVGAGHAQRAGIFGRETKTRIVGGIANQQHCAVAAPLRLPYRPPYQIGADTEAADIGGDRKRPEQQASLGGAGRDRPQPHRSDQALAIDGGERQAPGVCTLPSRRRSEDLPKRPGPKAASSRVSRAEMSAPRRSPRIVIRDGCLCCC